MVSDVINSIVTFIFLVAYQSVCYVLKSRICRRSSFICSIHFSFIASVEGLCYHFIFVLFLYFLYYSSRCEDQFTVLSLRFDSFHLSDTLGREASGVLRWIAPNPTWKECQNWYIYNDISIICEVLIANHFSVSLLWSGGSAHVRIHIFPSSRFIVNSKWRSLIQRVFYFSIQSS